MREKKTINVEIGRRVKAAREAAGITQERLAELVQLGPKNVSAIERGMAGISVGTMKRICEALSVSADMLFFDAKDGDNAVQILADRLKTLSPEQLDIAGRMLNTLFEAFSFTKEK